MSEQRPSSTGPLQVSGSRIAIVASEFNSAIVDGLLEGARVVLARHGISESQLTVVRVPGAWELPLASAHLADLERHDGIIALGAVIRGGTPHFEYVCRGCADGLMQVQQEYGLPVGFGVLTCDDEAQARARSIPGDANKGGECALAVLVMIHQLRQIRG